MHFPAALIVLAGVAAAVPTHKVPTAVQPMHPRSSPSKHGMNSYHCRVQPNLNILSCLGLDNNASGFNVSLPVNLGGVANGAASNLGGIADGSADGTANGIAKGAGTGLGAGLGSDLGGILGGDTDGSGLGGILKKE